MINIEIFVYMVYNGSNLKILNLMDEYCRFSRFESKPSTSHSSAQAHHLPVDVIR